MNLLHSLPSLSLNAGGPPRSVGQLCSHLCNHIESLHIISRYEGDEPQVDLDPRIQLSIVQPSGGNALTRLCASDYRKELERLHSSNPLNLIHRHGIWLKCSQDAVSFANRHHIPCVLSPRGMLEPWSLQYRGAKKKLAWYAYQRTNLQKVDMFHATSLMEAESIRACGLKQPIAVIPNGVEPAPVRPLDTALVTHEPVTKTALFLSRINPKKGLPMLIDAWRALNPHGWELHIAGNDDAKHLPELEAMVASYGLEGVIRFTGALFGAEKDAAYRNADIFVLPTYSENFGIVIAEALSYGVPVITTTGTPWQDLLQENCGWWVEPKLDTIQAALQQAISTDSDTLEVMGERGKKLIENQYLWGAIAENMTKAYRWLLGEGERPECILLD